jgi:tetratricopeptide (TPR) repeat protein
LNFAEASHLICAAASKFSAGDIFKATELATRATQCSEGSISEAYYNLGGYLLVQRRYKESRDCIRRALEIEPDYEIAKDRLDDIESVLLLQHTETVPIHILPTP